ncbi:MAG: hypothetical protein NW241_17575 [Bacteroidia bacterium]|nr:hypothetical protein [Bacteroidia bacterium]
MQFKTPGVYPQDAAPIRPTVPVLESAVPAFAGFTGKAQDASGASLHLKPVRIRDLAEFERFFGGAFVPERIRVYVDPAGGYQVRGADLQDRYFLYDCLRHYFDNGGGDCYIVSIGSYAEGLTPPPVAAPAPEDPCAQPMRGTAPAPAQPAAAQPAYARFTAGIDALAAFDEPTLILFPDAVRLLRAADGAPDAEALGLIQQHALAHCARMQDRFAILDLIPSGTLAETADAFRDAVGMQHLSYGAAYYPWVYSAYTHPFQYRELSFYEAGPWAAEGRLVPVPAAALSSAQNSPAAVQHRLLVSRAEAAAREMSLLLLHLRLNRTQAAQPAGYLQELNRSFRSAAQAAAAEALPACAAWLDTLLRMAETFAALDRVVSAALQRAIEDALPRFDLPNAIRRLIAAAGSAQAQLRCGPALAGRLAEAAVRLDGTRWLGGAAVADVPAADLQADEPLAAALAAAGEALGQAAAQLYQYAAAPERQADERLFREHPVFAQAADVLRLAFRRIPPSGAVAGVYVQTDALAGVWKAPANVLLRATLGPALPVDDRQQESLNADENGKAVNAIRSFPGRSGVIWGARTLMANSLEWRYVPVRRLFIFVEESLKKRVEPFLFEPNDANTWLQLRNSADALLRGLWRRGAFAGDTAEAAYFIAIGLGETMTQADVLEGRLIIEIGMAAARPAEFIVIRSEFRMEEP